MINYQPSLGVQETAQNIKFYIEAHMDTFWAILKPLLPAIVFLHLFDTIVDALYFPSSEEDFALGSILVAYLYTVLVISWHRVIIHGADSFTPMDPFRPKSHEWGFIWLSIKVFLIIFTATLVLTFIAAKLHAGLVAPVILIVVVAAIYFAYRVSFCFPAKAVNLPLTFKQSFALTKGYLWKIMLASALASLRYIGLLIAYFLIMLAVMAGVLLAFPVLMSAEGTESMGLSLIGFVLSVPILIYFQPLLTIVGVTALSNYYLHALQNRRCDTRS